MTGRCYVPGCRDAPILRLKYRDSLGEVCIEARCPTCARKLQQSPRTTVLDATQVGEGKRVRYDDLTKAEREAIRRVTSGPFSQFAA